MGRSQIVPNYSQHGRCFWPVRMRIGIVPAAFPNSRERGRFEYGDEFAFSRMFCRDNGSLASAFPNSLVTAHIGFSFVSSLIFVSRPLGMGIWEWVATENKKRREKKISRKSIFLKINKSVWGRSSEMFREAPTI